jgi:hypothetical protein
VSADAPRERKGRENQDEDRKADREQDRSPYPAADPLLRNAPPGTLGPLRASERGEVQSLPADCPTVPGPCPLGEGPPMVEQKGSELYRDAGTKTTERSWPSPFRPSAMTDTTRWRKIAVRFSLFLAVFLAIVGVIVVSKTLLIAPPYAVTAYLMVFNRGTKYAQPRSIVAAYLVVIASSVVFEYVLGVTLLALVLNVIVVSLFISFTPFSHPPALALTIFSYIVRDSPSFVLTSLVVLAIVALADVAMGRLAPLRRFLEDTPA